jgi:hypothetical protein
LVLVEFVNYILQFGVKTSKYNSKLSLELLQIDHHLEKWRKNIVFSIFENFSKGILVISIFVLWIILSLSTKRICLILHPYSSSYSHHLFDFQSSLPTLQLQLLVSSILLNKNPLSFDTISRFNLSKSFLSFIPGAEGLTKDCISCLLFSLNYF